MPLFTTLADVLNSQLDSAATIEFIDGEHDVASLTPAQLKARACNLLGVLHSAGMQSGDELIIHTPSNVEFVTGFWAAILGGFVPVPVAVGISDEHRSKLIRIGEQLKNPRLFTTTELMKRLTEFSDSSVLEASRYVPSDSAGESPGEEQPLGSSDLAFIQYSSGSTGDPKGVCLTHKNVTTNIRAIVEGAGWTGEDRALSWMPLTHDMGLIGFHLSVLAAGMSHAIMDTRVFIRRPKLWLSMAAERKTTILCSPNFGYQHVLKAIDRKGMDSLDLGHVRQIMNGAEPISKALCDTFNQTLAPHGLSANAMMPVYGLAEATVGVSMTPGDAPLVSTRVNRDRLSIGERIEVVDVDHANAIELVHVGRPIRDVQLRLVDNEGNELNAGAVGHIQLKGDSITERIYQDDDTTRSLFTADGWLQTGDSGALISDPYTESSLVIVGRIKDVLISSGQNFYAHDIEASVSAVEGAELGKVAVASVQPLDSATEQVAVFVVYRKELDDFESLATRIRAEIGARTGLEADLIVPVPRIPKTTSGKIQRRHLANAFMHGEFDHTLEAPGVRLSQESGAPSAPPVDAGDVCSQLVGIAREFVTEGQIGPDDNLFEVGVSSLTLTEIALAIEERFPGKLDVSDLFDYPTLRDLSEWVQRD